MTSQELQAQAIQDGELVQYNGYWWIGPYSCKTAREVLATFRRNGGKTQAEQREAQAQGRAEAQTVRAGIKRLQDLHAWEQTLQPGDLVEVRWTNCNAYYGAQAQIVRVNKASVSVALAEHVASQIGYDGYPVGHKINVPRVMAQTWSVNNGIRPVPPRASVADDPAPAVEPAPVPMAQPAADPPMAQAASDPTPSQPTLFDGTLTEDAAHLLAHGQISRPLATELALAQLDANRQHVVMCDLAAGRIVTVKALRTRCKALAQAQATEGQQGFTWGA